MDPGLRRGDEEKAAQRSGDVEGALCGREWEAWLLRGLAFSVEGQAEIRAMLERLDGNLRTAAAVFMTDDARAARRLVAEEEVFRDLEARATEGHFARIRAGRIESRETSALHIDVLRDLKRINAHLTAAADPVLDRNGELLSSRLRQEATEGP